jgi:hypothetical protein
MKDTRRVVALAVSGHAAMPGGANPQTSQPTMAPQARSPKELPDDREKDEWAGRSGTPFGWSVFTFVMEGFATYGASMHLVAAFSVEAALTAARRPHLWSASSKAGR